MNYISQYNENMTKDKGKDNEIDSGDKRKLNASVNLLKLLKANDHVTLLNISLKTIFLRENTIPQLHVGYISMSLG